MEKRILFDTNVYGRLALDSPFTSLLLEKKKNIEFIFYGNTIIRNELRATPKSIIMLNRNLRTYLLQIYDSLITKKNHNLPLNVFVEKLGQMYYNEYKKRKGNIGLIHIKSDFLIVACATIYQMDIIVSDDQRTLLSDAALNAYKQINQIQGFKNPTYIEYDIFRNKIIRKCGI